MTDAERAYITHQARDAAEDCRRPVIFNIAHGANAIAYILRGRPPLYHMGEYAVDFDLTVNKYALSEVYWYLNQDGDPYTSLRKGCEYAGVNYAYISRNLAPAIWVLGERYRGAGKLIQRSGMKKPPMLDLENADELLGNLLKSFEFMDHRKTSARFKFDVDGRDNGR